MGRPGVLLYAAVAIPLAAACSFFAYYSVRLAYINLTDTGIAGHRQTGMYIGAVAFPLAVLVFGYLSFVCARGAMRTAKAKT